MSVGWDMAGEPSPDSMYGSEGGGRWVLGCWGAGCWGAGCCTQYSRAQSRDEGRGDGEAVGTLLRDTDIVHNKGAVEVAVVRHGARCILEDAAVVGLMWAERK